ncbi:MAG: hypothetical protein A3J97_01470 [Spirochaetes bacterium RIFOXYC1_FULL_54_7]|nr:MAG: hypothetical protein A3J97_01470 [Spirochaetes bacterium RIFOXYC1_FULL_54_7]
MRAAGLVSAELEGPDRIVERVDLSTGDPHACIGQGGLAGPLYLYFGFSVPSTVLTALKSASHSDGAAVAMLCVCGAVMNKGRISGGWSGAASMQSWACSDGRATYQSA